MCVFVDQHVQLFVDQSRHWKAVAAVHFSTFLQGGGNRARLSVIYLGGFMI